MREVVLRVGAPLAMAAVMVACGTGDRPAGDASKPLVVAAFYPLVFAAQEVGGDLVRVENLTATGVEPHDLELSADQVGNVSQSDLVVFLGGGFQPALEDVLSGLDGDRALDILEAVEVPELTGDDGSDAAAPAGVDPHVWLDPSIMAAIADEVATRLGKIDPARRHIYLKNAERLGERLVELDRDFRNRLRSCRTREIVTSHAAFAYLAARYELRQVSVSGIDPEGEPSPGKLAEVARFVREHAVSTIFSEELVSPRVAETLAEETGARTAVLSPLESEPQSGDYIDAMEANLASLTKALDCG